MPVASTRSVRVVHFAYERSGDTFTDKIGNVQLDALIPYVQTNLLSTIYLLQPALPHLRKSKGRVVLVSSGASSTGYQAWGLYSMAKAGMNSLARTVASEEKENGVAIWSVRPGMVNVGNSLLYLFALC